MHPQKETATSGPSPASAAAAPVEKKKRNRRPAATDTVVGKLQAQLKEARPLQRCLDEIAKMSPWALEKVTQAVGARNIAVFDTANPPAQGKTSAN